MAMLPTEQYMFNANGKVVSLTASPTKDRVLATVQFEDDLIKEPTVIDLPLYLMPNFVPGTRCVLTIEKEF